VGVLLLRDVSMAEIFLIVIYCCFVRFCRDGLGSVIKGERILDGEIGLVEGCWNSS